MSGAPRVLVVEDDRELRELLEVAGVGDHNRKFSELIELAQLRSRFFLFSGGGSHVFGLLRSPRAE